MLHTYRLPKQRAMFSPTIFQEMAIWLGGKPPFPDANSKKNRLCYWFMGFKDGAVNPLNWQFATLCDLP